MSDTPKTKPDFEDGPRVNIAVSLPVHERLKVAAAVRGKSIRGAADEAIDKWVGKPERLGAEAAEAVTR